MLLPSGVMQDKGMQLIVEPAVMEDPESKKYPELFEDHQSSLDTWTLGDKGVGLCVCACVVADMGYIRICDCVSSELMLMYVCTYVRSRINR